MAESHKPFRYLIPNGTQFDFLRVSRPISRLSLLLLAGSVAALFINFYVRGAILNWTVDFKGGTEVILSFTDKTTGEAKPVSPGVARDALTRAGGHEVEVSDISWDDPNDKRIVGLVIRTADFGVVSSKQGDAVIAAIRDQLKDRQVDSVRWSGDQLHVRARQPISDADLEPLFKAGGIELKKTDDATAKINNTIDEGTGEYSMTFAASGLERVYADLIEKTVPGVDAHVSQSYTVSGKAGDELFYDGLKAIIYAMGLIMLYLVFRFDIRYAPGAIKATLHDAVLVIGVLAATWTPFSLSTLAALLTVVGYSVNDTAIVFDRIRENMAKHKDKKVEKIVNLSLNEVLGRSILTSLFVFSVTLMMNIFGDGLISNFAFVLNVGVVIGAASTIFLSAPVFVWIHNRYFSGSRPARNRVAMAVAEEP